MRKALLWGSDDTLLDSISDYLKGEWDCARVRTGDSLLRKVSQVPPDLILVVGLKPFPIEYRTLREIREQVKSRATLVAVLGFHFTGEEIVELLRNGADLVEDIDRGLTPAIARVEAIWLRLSEALHGGLPQDLVVNEIRLSTESANLVIADHQYQLTPTQARLVSFLLSRPNRIIPREEFQHHVWKGRTISGRTLDAHISKLKAQIPELADKIENIYGRGYRLCSS